MRPIDADAFKAEGRKLYRDAGWDLRELHYSQLDVECNIDMMPTIAAEPIKHGYWINDKGLYKCSVCNNFTITGWAGCIPIEYMNKTMKYCNNCGARNGRGE